MHATQAGIDGLVLRDGDDAAGGWPADALRGGRTSARWAKGLLREVRPPGTRLPPSVAVLRFRTREVVGMLWPPSDRNVGVAAMQGATRVVWPQAVGQQDLVRAAGRAGMWLVRHQREDGLFRYLFQHQTQSWSSDDSLVRQAGCAWAMARLARRLPDAGFAAPTKRAIEGLEQLSLKRGGPGNLAYMQVGDDPPRLGAIPLFLLAADEWDRHSPIDESTRERLAATLLAVQSPEGGFGVDARGLTLEGSETYYAGQIALALARRFEVTGRQRMAEAGLAALRYYRQWWDDGNRDLSFVTWMLQACEAWYRLRYDDEARDFGFEMADWALQFQHSDDVNLLWGGAFESTPGIGTAAYTEGIVRAVAIAEQAGDAERAERYSNSVRGAMRFLMQLCVEDPDLAFTGGPEQRARCGRRCGGATCAATTRSTSSWRRWAPSRWSTPTNRRSESDRGGAGRARRAQPQFRQTPPQHGRLDLKAGGEGGRARPPRRGPQRRRRQQQLRREVIAERLPLVRVGGRRDAVEVAQDDVPQLVRQGEAGLGERVLTVEDDQPAAVDEVAAAAQAGVQAVVEHDAGARIPAGQAVEHGDRRDGRAGEPGRRAAQRLPGRRALSRLRGTRDRRGRRRRWPAARDGMPHPARRGRRPARARRRR